MRSVVLLVAITLALGAQAAPAATEDPPPAGFDPATHAAIVGAAPLLLNDFGHWMNLL